MINRCLIVVLALAFGMKAGAQTRPVPGVDTPATKVSWYLKNPPRDTVVKVWLQKGMKYKITVSPVKAEPDKYTWYKRISVVKAFDNATNKAAAASVSLVYPKDSVSNQNFAFAVGYNVWSNRSYHYGEVTMQINPFFGWQKNTLSSKKQDVITSGLNYQVALPKFSPNDAVQFFAVAAVNYKNDRIKTSEGTQANLYLSPIFNGKAGKFYFLPDAEMKNDVLKLTYNLFAGLEYENVSAAKKTVDKGTVNRFYGRVTATVIPLPVLLDERLQFVPDYTYRSALSNSIASEQNINKLWKYSVNLVLIKKADSGFGDVSLGYDRQTGVDPAAGYQDQTVGTFTVKVKITPGAK